MLDMTDNETAKLHIRYMVGGHAAGIGEETLVRFEFPERPGALLDFLIALGKRWNITLFHYRNHGAAYGRVLMGAEVPPGGPGRLPRVARRPGLSLLGGDRKSGLSDLCGREAWPSEASPQSDES